jgi:hypothetical protein
VNLFEQAYKDSYLKHHTNPIVPNSLDPRVFYFPPEGGDPTIHPLIKNQILTDIAKINTAQGDYGTTMVKDYVIVGPILKANSSDNCPITIKVEIDTTNLNDMVKEKVLNIIKEINGDPNDKNSKRCTYAAGTQHPIVYIPTIRNFSVNEFESAYHPYTDKWLKKPRFLGEKADTLTSLAKDPVKKKRKHNLMRSELRKHLFQTKN